MEQPDVDEPVFLSTGIGNTLAYGSCDSTYYGRLIGYYDTCFKGPDVDPEQVDESVRDLAPRDYAFDYIDDDETMFEHAPQDRLLGVVQVDFVVLKAFQQRAGHASIVDDLGRRNRLWPLKRKRGRR